MAAAYTLGLPHPPGNPFFVLLGRVFTLLPIAPSIAMRVNILAALTSAIAAGAWFLITERVLSGWFVQRWPRILGGALAALLGATAFTVWNQSVVNEKVYTVSLGFFAIVAWLCVRWADDPYGAKADRILVLIAYLIGLGYANHPAGFLVGPAVAVAVLARRWQTLLRWKLLLACGGALVLGMTVFATQPIRSAHFPPINEGETTACTDGLKADCTFSKLTWQRWKYNFDREQYGKPPLSMRQAPFVHGQVGMWWLYFKWQWMRDSLVDHPREQNALAVAFLLLGLVGGWVHYKRDRRSFWFFGPLVFTCTVMLIYYMNFKYGASQSPDLGNSVPREVRDRDYFYLWSYSAWAVWAALGLMWVWETIAAIFGRETERVGAEVVERPTKRGLAIASPILALAVLPLWLNWESASRAGQTDTRDFAHDLLNSVEPYGVLVTVGDNDTFPLWYAQEVEGIRKDVVIANTSLLNTDWYTRQLIRRPVFEYDSLTGPKIYRGKRWPKPGGSPLKLTMEQADAVPLIVSIDRPAVFQAGNVRALLVPPRELQRADVLVLQIIKDSHAERPIYFSRTSGGYGTELGFQRYLLTQGLARKLMPDTVRATRDTMLIPGEGYLDVPRTEALWDSVFEAKTSIAKRKDWPDQPSVGIPYLYVATGGILAEALQRLGRPQDSNRILAETRAVAKSTRLDQIFEALEQQQPQSDIPLTESAGGAGAIPLRP
ncbi:MAG TPA: DUF2723 domain-containing protein [Gemmatimonadaceae bacterium]|nr:DUF2723 domain-containing protein [Gemmatimonadaceae bacterium]